MTTKTRFEERQFSIGELSGISAKSIEEHKKLYAGYVKNANLILDSIDALGADAEKNAYAIGELQRRFGFEFNGIKNHEYYFENLEGGKKMLGDSSRLKASIEAEWGSFDAWLARFKALAMTRGIGWAMLLADPKTKTLTHAWIDEQHLGQLNGMHVILALDMWEHSYMLDYAPSEKKKYVEAFFENLNWEHCENRFEALG